MRISEAIGAVLALLLAGCGGGATDNTVLANVEGAQVERGEAAGRIECRLADSETFLRQCTVERTATEEGAVLTVRQPDGAFHRLLITRDGRGVVAADGAEAAEVSVLGADQIEVAMGDVRYRLPAQVGPVASR